MIVDVHTHIFPPEIMERRAEHCLEEPAFKLLYESPKSKMVGVTELIEAMDENGVDISVVFGFPWSDLETAKRNNDYIMEAVSRYPDRIVGLGCMDPSNRLAADEAKRCLEGGLAGIGELALYRSGIDKEALMQMEPIMALCREHNRPLLMHTNESIGHSYPGKAPITLEQIYTFIKTYPDNLIILAHWGGGLFFFNLLKRELKEDLKNVYFDTAASPFLYDPAVYQAAIRIIGVEKILFGSDYPLLKPKRYFGEMEQAALSSEDMQKICGLNTSRIFNLPPV